MKKNGREKRKFREKKIDEEVQKKKEEIQRRKEQERREKEEKERARKTEEDLFSLELPSTPTSTQKQQTVTPQKKDSSFKDLFDEQDDTMDDIFSTTAKDDTSPKEDIS